MIKSDLDENPGFLEVARGYLERSVDLIGAEADAHLKLAITYSKLGDIQQAKAQAEIAINKGIQGRALQKARSILEMR